VPNKKDIIAKKEVGWEGKGVGHSRNSKEEYGLFNGCKDV
jgi:hypothetical protein